MNSLILFFISPIISYFRALKDIRFKASIISLILIGGFIGYMMNTGRPELDLYRYLRMLNESHDIKYVITRLLTGKEVDLYAPISISLIGSFTKNGHILMMWFGLIFGILYSKSLTRFNNSNDLISILFIIFFANIYGYNSLAGVRFATAFYVLFIGITGYTENKENNIKYLFIILASALFHFGMLPGIILFLVYLLLKKWPFVIYILTIISFGFTFIDIESILSQGAGILGKGFSARAEIYSTGNQEYVNYLKHNSGKVVWFIKYRSEIAIYTISLYLLFLQLYRNKYKISKSNNEYLLFILLWLTLRNLIYNVPDFGIRYSIAFIAFSVYFAYRFFSENHELDLWIKIPSLFVLFGCLLCCVYSVRQLFDYINFYDIVLTPFYGVVTTFI